MFQDRQRLHTRTAEGREERLLREISNAKLAGPGADWVEEAGGGLGWGVGWGEDPPLTAIYSIPLSQDLRKTVRGLVDL